METKECLYGPLEYTLENQSGTADTIVNLKVMHGRPSQVRSCRNSYHIVNIGYNQIKYENRQLPF